MSTLEKSLREDAAKIPVYNQKDLSIINGLITDITSGKKTKEDYKNVLESVKKDKQLKSYLVNKVVEKIFGKGKLSFLIKMAVKVYLSTKFGI